VLPVQPLPAPKAAPPAPQPVPPAVKPLPVEPAPSTAVKPLPASPPVPKSLPVQSAPAPKPLPPIAAAPPQVKPPPAEPAKPPPSQPAAPQVKSLPPEPPPPPPPPLPQRVARVEPPPVQPSCNKEPMQFHVDQNETISGPVTIVGGAACHHAYWSEGTTQFSGASISEQPSNGVLTQTGDYEFEYRPHKGFRGSDEYAVEICGQNDNGSGCSTITYEVTVQ
jgi:hypothetical protein